MTLEFFIIKQNTHFPSLLIRHLKKGFCNKPKFSNSHIFTTQYRKPLGIQTMNSVRLNN